MEIYRTVNSHRKSNSYFLQVSENEIVIIDVGDFDLNSFQQWLLHKRFIVIAVVLTHEHSDHCLGVNPLSEILNFPLYVSRLCGENIKDPKKNYSKYIEEIKSFSIYRDIIVVEDEAQILFGNYHLTFFETPGHSPGSIIIKVNDFLFTGDTLMEFKTPLNFPESSKTDYWNSMRKIYNTIDNNTIVYPGHGDSFRPEKKKSSLQFQ